MCANILNLRYILIIRIAITISKKKKTLKRKTRTLQTQ